MSTITGAVVGATGYVASRPLLATFILIFIILAVVLHYSWGSITKTIKGKSADNTEHLFDDFHYSDKNRPDGKDENSKPGN